MKKILCACLSFFMLVGCSHSNNSTSQSNTDVATMDALDDSYYKIIKQDNKESTREKFYLNYGGTSDFQTIGRGLQLLSTDYFSTGNYYMSEGQYITLDVWTELLTSKAKSSSSLQPDTGEVIDGVDTPIMVSSLYEQDFYISNNGSYDLKGVSFSIVIDPMKTNGSSLDSSMSDATIKSYGERAIKALYQYIQNNKAMKDIKSLPILIAVYQGTDKSKSTVDGQYILSSYCNKEVGEIKTLDYENVVFTSAQSEEIDKTTSSEFATIKSKLKEASTEAAGLVGVGKYKAGEIQSMVITATLNVKTYSELLYLTSILTDNINAKFSYSFDIRVIVNSQDGLEAVIIKNKGEKAKPTFMY